MRFSHSCVSDGLFQLPMLSSAVILIYSCYSNSFPAAGSGKSGTMWANLAFAVRERGKHQDVI
jgi:hypothetical protein